MSTAPAIEPITGPDASAFCEPILRSVPQWFGIESSTRAYIEAAARLPTWAARLNGAPAGFITLERHFPESAEVHCMAVRLDFHGRGVGSAMVRFVEDHLRADGVGYLQVKTMGPSKPNEEYRRTTHFYRRCGFVPLQEVHGLWPGLPCLILVKSL